MYTTPLSTLVSSLSLNHHQYADDTQLFLSFHPSDFHSNINHLQNALQQISSWMTANLLTLSSSKTEFFFLLDLNNNSLKYTTPLSLQPTLLAILVLFSTNTLPSRTKSLHFLNLATITFVNFTVSAHTLTSKQPAPLPTSIVHSKLDYCNSLYYYFLNYLTGSNRFKTLLLMVLLRVLNPHITPILKSLH